MMEKISIPEGETDECWLWCGAKGRDGYGHIKNLGKTVSAHRMMWKISVSEIPEGKHVLHHCDNRLCVRPDHLFMGTNSDNCIDKFQKGRGVAKVTIAGVKTIRSMEGFQKDIAKQFGIDQSQVSRIKSRKDWRHV